MINLLSILLYSSMFIVIILLSIANLRSRKKRLEWIEKYMQESVDKASIAKHLQNMIVEKESRSIEKTDGFLKFVSDSRDWAFKYIEDVQDALVVFANKVEPELKYAATYGKSIENPHSLMLERISIAYEELKTILPKDDEKIV